MKINYDPKVDAVYFEFSKGAYYHTRKVNDDVLVDEDKKGKVLGIEILDASINIPSFDPKNIVVSQSKNAAR